MPVNTTMGDKVKTEMQTLAPVLGSLGTSEISERPRSCFGLQHRQIL